MRDGFGGLAGRASGGGLGGAVAGGVCVGGYGICVGSLGGLAAHGVAEAEEAGAEQHEREEDAQNGRRAERDFAVGAATGTGPVRIAGVAAARRTIVFVVVGTIHIYSFGAESGAAGATWAAMVLLNMLTSSMGSGKTMVVFFSTPISVRVCR